MMRGSLGVVVAAVALGVAGASVAQDLDGATAIELADQGLLECSSPDVRRKTCRSIGSYERIREGVYNSTTVMDVGNGVTLELYSPVWLVDDAFCGSIREQDVLTGIIRVNGREIAPQLAASGLQQALRQLRPVIDQELCWRYEPSGASFVGKATIGGTYRPELDATVKMVSPSEGYRVAR